MSPRNARLTPRRPKPEDFHPRTDDLCGGEPYDEWLADYEYTLALHRYERGKLRAVHAACYALATQDNARAWRWAQGIPENQPQHVDNEPVPF